MEWETCRHCNLKDLQSIIGYLQFCAQVVPHGHMFIHSLINFLMTFKSSFSLRYIPAYTHADIQWWLSYAHAWNSIQILDPLKPMLHMYTNARSSKGLGGIFGNVWFSTRFPCHFRSRDIQLKEIYVVLQAILQWGLSWEGHYVMFHIIAAQLGFFYSLSWVSSANNQLADTTSQFEYAQLFTVAPLMQMKPCPMHPQLCGIKHTLTCLPRSLSSCGMASLP